MIPSVLAEQVERGVKDFLLTTFPITNPFFEGCLERLLAQKDALFRGPFLSMKLPFVPAASGPALFTEVLPPGWQPYRHQQRAFERLDTRTGLNTLVATGTGSGKTECFLYPILDHCLRNRGRRGIKAIVIYPLNALALDQSKRFAKAIHANPELHGYVTAGLYLGGQEAEASPVMTENQVITDRNAMRNAPPDILLTNYKMLDYLLVRAADLLLWRENGPETLRYLVLDELHTFDGAQGADLACLIRRVKERVKAPRGQVVCVGTSATLGDSGAEMARELAAYATRVFGEPFSEESLIGESVLTPDEFLKGCLIKYVQVAGYECKTELDPLRYGSTAEYVRVQARLWLGAGAPEGDEGRIALGLALRSHAFFRNLLTILEGRPKDIDTLLDEIEKQIPSFGHPDRDYLAMLLASFVTLVSEARVASPRGPEPLVQVRYQLWLRELRRMVSLVGPKPALAFAGDLKPEQLQRSLPVIHCRECGLTGWGGTVKDADNKLNTDLKEFYVQFFENSPHVVFVFPGNDVAPPQDRTEIPTWLCARCLRFERAHEAAKCLWCGAGPELSLSVWIPDTVERREAGNGQRARLEGTHDCPSCRAPGSLTIVGSRAASLTSVMISQIFASSFNADKKLLAFSDNVQDASHRAGFFGARTFTFNFRAALDAAVRDASGPLAFSCVTPRFLERWENDPRGQAWFLTTFLPPDMDWLQDYAELRENGKLPDGSNLPELVRRRLDWEIWSEYTVDCRIGRTLEKTGCSTLEVRSEILEPALESLLGASERNRRASRP